MVCFVCETLKCYHENYRVGDNTRSMTNSTLKYYLGILTVFNLLVCEFFIQCNYSTSKIYKYRPVSFAKLKILIEN